MSRKPVLRLIPVLALALLSGGTSLRAAAAPADLAARIDPLFKDFRPDGPGCAVGVMRDGALVFAKGYGLALAGLAGTYRSEELDSTWTLEARGGKLILHRRRHRDTTLSAAFADGFIADGGGLILFERGQDRRVTGLAVTVPGARNVRFVRDSNRL